MAARFLRPHRSETAAFAKQMMERSYQMAPLRRAAAAESLVIGDHLKSCKNLMGGRKKDKILLADICKMYYTKITKKWRVPFFVSGHVQTQWVLFRPGAPKKEVVSR